MERVSEHHAQGSVSEPSEVRQACLRWKAKEQKTDPIVPIGLCGAPDALPMNDGNELTCVSSS